VLDRESESATDRLRQTDRWLRERRGDFSTYTWRLGCGIYWFALDLSGFSLAWIVHDGRMGWTGTETGRLFPLEFLFLDGCSQEGERERALHFHVRLHVGATFRREGIVDDEEAGPLV
jgi:hypothetical protein